MVRIPGIDTFAEHFSADQTRFVVIGGTARELIYEKHGYLEESITRDLDVVLIAEALDASFTKRFVDFITKGGYQHQAKDGKSQMFRFSHPKDETFPAQIELLSKRPDFIENMEQHIGPIPVDSSVYSLSAILLDNGYYQLISSGIAITTEFGIPTLRHEYLPLFKMRAYNDLIAENKREANKHRRDIIGLFSLNMPPAPTNLPESILEDVRLFTESADIPRNLMKSLNLGQISGKEMLDIIRKYYLEES